MLIALVVKRDALLLAYEVLHGHKVEHQTLAPFLAKMWQKMRDSVEVTLTPVFIVDLPAGSLRG